MNESSALQMYILKSIARGNEREEHICGVLHITRRTFREHIEKLGQMGLVERQGWLFRRKWKLTSEGIEVLSSARHEIEIPMKIESPVQKQEIKHVTDWLAPFRLSFGVLMGIFVAWLVIGIIASAIYFFGYHLLIKKYVPEILLPYIPFESLWVDLVLGLMSSAALFLPLRRKIGLIPMMQQTRGV